MKDFNEKKQKEFIQRLEGALGQPSDAGLSEADMGQIALLEKVKKGKEMKERKMKENKISKLAELTIALAELHTRYDKNVNRSIKRLEYIVCLTISFILGFVLITAIKYYELLKAIT